ncbi:MAG: LLM class oxidoreductase [Bacteroidota bacterium]
MKAFEPINRAYNTVFQPEKLSIGLVVPIEQYAQHALPRMQDHITRVQLAEQMGFKAIWLRDIPLHVPSFGDTGQGFDPFTYLGFLAAHTTKIGLGIASIALPLHHPLHVAKSAATIDQLSGGRMLLGIASGDRPDEYPAMGIDFAQRGQLFKEAFTYLRKAAEAFPATEKSYFGQLNGGVDVLPKPSGHKIPLLLTGYSRQSLEWNAQHADGWMSYPRNIGQQRYTLVQWRELIAETGSYDKPFMQPLYVILDEHDDAKPIPIQLGFKIGVKYLVEYCQLLQEIGVNHLAINLRFSEMPIEKTLERLATHFLPHFHPHSTEKHHG